MKQLRVVQISESAFTVQGHGVHTAYVETVKGLEHCDDVQVQTNSFAPADIRHIHTVGPYSLLQLLRPGRKVISGHVVPASFVGSLVGAKYWLWAATLYLRWFYNRAAVVIAVSDGTKRELERIGVRSRIEVIYNMIDTSAYASTDEERTAIRTKLGIAVGEVVVTSNGQVQPRKRVDTFLRIASEFPNLRFIWIGGMPFGKTAADHSAMQKLVDTAPENVTFTGVVPLSAVREYFVASDIFVSTSEQETFGIAIVEAAAAGNPIVLRDIADYDQTFRPDAVMCDERAFPDAIERLVDDTSYYDEMCHHAAALAERYDSKTIARQLVDIYRSCLDA